MGGGTERSDDRERKLRISDSRPVRAEGVGAAEEEGAAEGAADDGSCGRGGGGGGGGDVDAAAGGTPSDGASVSLRLRREWREPAFRMSLNRLARAGVPDPACCCGACCSAGGAGGGGGGGGTAAVGRAARALVALAGLDAAPLAAVGRGLLLADARLADAFCVNLSFCGVGILDVGRALLLLVGRDAPAARAERARSSEGSRSAAATGDAAARFLADRRRRCLDAVGMPEEGAGGVALCASPLLLRVRPSPGVAGSSQSLSESSSLKAVRCGAGCCEKGSTRHCRALCSGRCPAERWQWMSWRASACFSAAAACVAAARCASSARAAS